MTISFAAYTPRVDYDAELGTSASQWNDQSGNGHHATQVTVSKQMAVVASPTSAATGASVNGIPAMRAVWGTGTTGKSWDIPDAAFSGMTGAVGAEAFIVYMRDADPGISANSTDGGVWQLGNGNASWQPWPGNSNFYENFCSSARKDNIFANTRRGCFKPMILNAYSATNDFGVIVNGGLKWGMQYTTVTNTFQVPPAGNAKIGCSGTAADGGAGAYAFTGYIWRFLLFARKLTSTERTEITDSLATYYSAAQSIDIIPRTTSVVFNGRPFGSERLDSEPSANRSLIVTSRPSTAVFSGSLSDIRDTKPDVQPTKSTSSGSTTLVTLLNVTTYYKMRGVDPDCGTLTYRTWVVTGAPDTTGALYSGPKCGANPLTNITIIGSWQVAA